MRALVVLVGLISLSTPAFAQTAGNRPTGRIEIDAGGGLLGGADRGSADANLQANAQPLQPFRLFSTDSRVASAPTWHLRAGYAFNRRFGVEGGIVVSHPELRTSVSGDIEGAPTLTVAEQLDQYFFEGSLIVMLDELGIGSRTVPFVSGGAGYLRRLHEGLTLSEDGQVYHAGGGIKHWFVVRARGPIRAVGLRADARFYLLAARASSDLSTKSHGAISGSIFVAF